MFHQYKQNRRLIIPVLIFISLATFFSGFHAFISQQTAFASDPPLKVEIQAAHNLVVDSNVSSPSTYAPRVATVAGRFCNTTAIPMTNVYGHIGNHAAQTPGEYPATMDWVIDPGRAYAFTHIGGAIGTADATRYVGDLEPGECKVQYWSFTYPACAHDAAGAPVEPPCTTTPTWGSSIKPDDDLSMRFDIWAMADGTGGPVADNASWTMTTRNEISAMANKIRPNPDGHWFNTDTSVVVPGSVITTNGVLYSLGNVRFGFDNDGDFVPDYNAWLQPFGDPSYDPSCFRLIRSTTVLTVSRSGGNPNLIIHTDDHNIHPAYGGPLYFTNLPPDNNGVRGEVRYTFLALSGPCSLPISPYQEVASGYDNEKFNGDFGTGIPTIQSSEPEVTISKSGPDSVAENFIFTYNIPFANLSGDTSAGLTLNSSGINMPLSIRDVVPEGLEYIGATAETNNIVPTGCTENCFTMRYSVDGGESWSADDPGTVVSTAENPVIIEWWLNDPLPANGSGAVTFQARVPTNYINNGGTPFIENEACTNFGGGTDFACDTDVMMVSGDNSIGDFVWRDLNADGLQDGGAETGIAGITAWLYWDKNGDGVLDDGDLLIATTTTDVNGGYLFPDLPAGDYLIVVDSDDPDLPAGYANTTSAVHAVTGLSGGATYSLADFGFGPVLSLIKRVVANPGPPALPPAYEGHPVTYEIELTNNLPGEGTGQPTSCSYTVWGNIATVPSQQNQRWQFPEHAEGTPNGVYALGPYQNAGERITLNNFQLGYANPNSIIDSVELLLPLRVNPIFGNNETLIIRVFDGETSLLENTYNVNADLSTGIFIIDASNIRAWSWNDFNGTNIRVQLEAGRQGNNSGTMELDAVGFQIETQDDCGGPNGTIDPLPLTDTFEADKLEFVSASMTPNSVSTAGSIGTISWNNVGPLHAGQTKTIEVTFLALEPAGNVATTVTNEAEVTGATFSNGRPVNDAWDDETIGLEPTGSISGIVWNDNGEGSGVDSNGVQDGDEAGIAGVTVYLCTDLICNSGSAVATIVTDADGNYTFTGLLDGNYYTAVETDSLPAGNVQTGDPDVPGANCSTGVCDNQTTNPVTVSSAADVTNINYGYTVPNTIYGTIWHDHNGEGDLTDATGIAGVTVSLTPPADIDLGNGAGNPITTVTDANGSYTFGNVPDGTGYLITVDPATLPDAGEIDVDWAQTFDPDATPDNEHAIPVTIENGNIYGSFDFGYYKGGDYGISGTVYADWNGNNMLDGEPGFAGVTVTLYDEDGNLVAVTITDENGQYTFDDLPPGTFTVVIDENGLPAQYSQSEEPENPGLPCTACNGQGTVTIGSASVSDFNFGYEPAGYATIGDFVWHDLNGDGYQNAGEPGLANITVNLYVDYGYGYQLVDSTETNGSGFYSFTHLPPGDYRVVVDTADPNLPLDAHGSSFVPTTPSFFDVSLASGQTYLEADFGFAPGGVIGNTLYWDANGNADQDAAELGIPSVTVALWVWDADAGSWIFYADTVTDADGEYLFTGLPRGDYQVRVDTSSGPINGRTLTGDPDTNGIPCDPDPGAPWTVYCDSQHEVEIRPGQTYLGANFGYRPIGVIGDYIWLDSNGDGVQDPGEGPIAYINVWLCTTHSPCDADTAILATTSDTDGYYSFSNIGNGTWTVAVDESTLPAGLSATYDLDSGTTNPDGITAVVLANAGDSNLVADFGYRYVGDYAISGYLFDHPVGAEGDPIVRPEGPRVQSGDLTYTDVTVYLWRQNDSGGYTLIAETVTGSNGYYAFGELPPGDYAVSVNANDPALQDNRHATHVGVYGINAENDGMVFEYVEIENADIQHIDFGFAGDGSPTAVTLTTLMAYTPIGGHSLLLVMLLIMMITGGLLAARIRRSQA